MLFIKWGFIAIIVLLITSCAGTATKPSETPSPASPISSPSPKKPITTASPKPTTSPEIAVNPGVRVQYDNAVGAMRSGNIAQAKNMMVHLTQSYPNLAGPYVNLGIIHFRDDEIEKAEQAFQQALKVNSKSAVSLNHLGIIYRGKGKFSEARKNYENALRIDPDYAYAHLNFGILLDLYLGELENALDHYQRFQQLTAQEDKEVKKWIVDLQRRIKAAK
ncbi:MAG: tetratricopeptide repeat protein [Gammaproteobacteria bacterium]|nr:tetratricopeptide repeat protein [Gammaproteobacteria bacterium]